MLKVENLSKTYAGSQKPSVDNISFEVKDGEIFGFIGPNGAGKSTTIKCIAGIISISDGDVYINGKSMRADSLAAKREIGYVSDDHAMYDGLTGVEYINFIADVFMVSAAEREERLNRYLEMFALGDAIKKQISTYSHGMKQKLNIIGALIHEPKLWILDEPMTGLDPRSSYNLKLLMREHADRGNSVFFSSHVLEVVEKVCDRVGIIEDGHLITVCGLDELKARNVDKSLEELFLKLTDEEFADKAYSAPSPAAKTASDSPAIDKNAEKTNFEGEQAQITASIDGAQNGNARSTENINAQVDEGENLESTPANSGESGGEGDK